MMNSEIIALIPAGGHGSRISPIPCSKEIFPLGFQYFDQINGYRPKVVSQYLLDNLKTAGITKAFFVIRAGKWDIPKYFENGDQFGMNLAYITSNEPLGHPFTIEKAFPFVKDKVIAFAYPDIIVKPRNAFYEMRQELYNRVNADLLLGLFPVKDSSKWDMIQLSNDKVEQIKLKPEGYGLKYTWAFALWRPSFTSFMSQHLQTIKEDLSTNKNETPKQEIILDHIINQAIKNNLNIEAITFNEGSCLDIGTPNDLKKAISLEYQHNFTRT